MTILALKKITVISTAEHRRNLLSGLQDRGCMHVIASNTKTMPDENVSYENIDEVRQALHYLLNTRNKRHQINASENFDLALMVKEILENKQNLRDVSDQKDSLNQRIKDLEPWGDFKLPQKGINDYKLWFYIVPHNKVSELKKIDYVWKTIYKNHRESYVVVISKNEPDASSMPAERTHTGSSSLAELKNELSQCIVKLEDLQAEREALTRWIFLLSKNYARAEDISALHKVEAQMYNDENISVLQGWVSEQNIKQVQEFVEQEGFALLIESPAENDRPPSYIQNPESIGGAEDLVKFYQTPGYHAWDPSRIVFYSFSLFFAMILADAGYSLVLALILGYFWKTMGASQSGQRFRRLAVSVLSVSFVYGVMVGGYFGITLQEHSILSQLQVLELSDFNTMMKISITIGCIHIALANLVTSIKASDFSGRAKPLGWIAVIFGGLSYWLSQSSTEPAWFGQIAIPSMILGLTIVFLFSSSRQLTSIKGILLRLVDGFMSLTNFTKLFGDVLSYMRLFALGLASSSLALTFNQLADQVREGLPGLGLLLSIIILILGHSINLGLGIISGFVHGLRLNFIEFFNWGISDEGYPFRAFARKEKNYE